MKAFEKWLEIVEPGAVRMIEVDGVTARVEVKKTVAAPVGFGRRVWLKVLSIRPDNTNHPPAFVFDSKPARADTRLKLL